MSGITSGVGLFSGINTRQLIDQLLQIEARPKALAQIRVSQLQAQQAAYLDLNSALLGLKTAAAAFNARDIFRASQAVSSQPTILAATAANNAATGSFSVTVARLTATHQFISRGFDNKDVTGLGASAFTFEVGGGRLDSDTTLGELNGGEGVARGKIKITDSDGASAVIDLSKAVTVNDVLDAINSTTSISVAASVNGDRVQVRDTAGGASSFQIENVFGATTATSLGIAGSTAAGGTITSAQSLVYLSNATPLSRLRDSAGVSFGPDNPAAPADFIIAITDAGTPSNTVTFDVVLGAQGHFEDSEFIVDSPAVSTIGDLIARINSETGGAVTASVSADGRSIVLTDTTGDTNRTLGVVEGASRSAATDLGLIGVAAAGAQGSQTLTSARLVAGLNSTLASNLNGGAGVGAGSISVTRRDGASFSVSIAANASVADILDAFNAAGGGIVTARLNDTGAGIVIEDSSSGGNLIISDTTGAAAAGLNIATAGEADGEIDSGSLQARYISGATRLASLNGGRGVGLGEFKIFDSVGASATIKVTSEHRTIDDLVKLINDRAPALGVLARVNDNGDGVIIEDTAGGSQKLKVEDSVGTVARRLNLAGESESSTPGSNEIDGTFERRVEFSAGDTLQEVVDAINGSGVGVDASIVNTGSAVSPFKVILTSETTGRIGRFVVDTQGFDLGLQQLSQGEDAVAFFGSGDPAGAVLLTSSTNTLDNVVSGVSIDLLSASSSPVEVTVSRDTAAVEDVISKFIEAYNKVQSRLDFHDRFNSETKERGALLGDSTVANIRTALFTRIQAAPTGVSSQFSRLFQVGVRLGEGGSLEFDRERFRAALQQDPQGVADLFAAFEVAEREDTVLATDSDGNPTITTPNTGPQSHTRLGVAEQIELLATNLTGVVDGLLTQRRQTLDTQIESQNERIELFDLQLEVKRTRLERQFAALEQALASLQTQQAALTSLASRQG